jgi:nicotinamide mononucleotide transporter
VEIIAFLLSLICVLLNALGRTLTWPFAIASSAVYAWVFHDAKLFGDAALQIVFIALAVYGWWCWGNNRSRTSQQKPSHIKKRDQLILAIALSLVFIILRAGLIRYTSSDVPTIDALLTGASLIATYMSAKRWIENWIIWAISDLTYIGLYIYKQLYLTALLYGIFIILCILGWKQWSKQIGNP